MAISQAHVYQSFLLCLSLCSLGLGDNVLNGIMGNDGDLDSTATPAGVNQCSYKKRQTKRQEAVAEPIESTSDEHLE